MAHVLEDLRIALRALRRNAGFTLIAVATLGLALGANAGIFTVVDAAVLRPLPYAEPDRLVYLAASAPGSDLPGEFRPSWEFYLHYRERSVLLEEIATYTAFTSTLRAGDRVERVPMSRATNSLFGTLNSSPALGRLPTAEDGDQVVVISDALWTSWFGSDPGVIGRSIYVDSPDGGADRTIIGVMPPEFGFPSPATTVWIPWTVTPESFAEPGLFNRQFTIGRMAAAASIESVTTELRSLAEELPERYGGSSSYAATIERHEPIVRPLAEQVYGFIKRPLLVLLACVGFVLLIACANIANLFAVRASTRRNELTVRSALGAGRAHLIGLQLAEAFVIAILAGALALFVANASVPMLLAAAPLPPTALALASATVGAPTILFVLAASVFAALACGLAPAVRSSSPSLTRLRQAGRGSTRPIGRGQYGLVAGQTALTLVLLIASGLLIRSSLAIRAVDPGFDLDNLVTFQIAPERGDLGDELSYAQFHTDFMDRVAALPGVESVGVIENLPLNEEVRAGRFLTEEMSGGAAEGLPFGFTWAGGDYFAAMGIDLLRGRVFGRDDDLAGQGNAIVSRSAADRLWPGQDPIGRRFRREGQDDWLTVEGVVEDVMQSNFRGPADPLVYLPLDAGVIATPAYVVRSTRALDLVPQIRALVREVAPTAPMYRVFTMEGLASDSVMPLSFITLGLGITAALGLILAMVGLYGVLSFIVTSRRREIGMRMALGARMSRVQRMIVSQGAAVVGLGVVAGAVLAAGSTRLLGSVLFGVEPVDAATFAAMSLMMVVLGVLASYLPARRASSVDPVECLKGE